jgi:hypothetical protein
VRFDPSAQCPWWIEFLNTIMGGDRELIEYLQRVVGSAFAQSAGSASCAPKLGSKRNSVGADDLAGIAHIKVDVGVIWWRLIPDALELAAANAHDRHPDFIMKRRITFHLQRAA